MNYVTLVHEYSPSTGAPFAILSYIAALQDANHGLAIFIPAGTLSARFPKAAVHIAKLVDSGQLAHAKAGSGHMYRVTTTPPEGEEMPPERDYVMEAVSALAERLEAVETRLAAVELLRANELQTAAPGKWEAKRQLEYVAGNEAEEAMYNLLLEICTSTGDFQDHQNAASTLVAQGYTRRQIWEQFGQRGKGWYYTEAFQREANTRPAPGTIVKCAARAMEWAARTVDNAAVDALVDEWLGMVGRANGRPPGMTKEHSRDLSQISGMPQREARFALVEFKKKHRISLEAIVSERTAVTTT